MIWLALLLPLLIWAWIALSYRSRSDVRKTIEIKANKEQEHQDALKQARERRWEEVRKGSQ